MTFCRIVGRAAERIDDFNPGEPDLVYNLASGKREQARNQPPEIIVTLSVIGVGQPVDTVDTDQFAELELTVSRFFSLEISRQCRESKRRYFSTVVVVEELLTYV